MDDRIIDKPVDQLLHADLTYKIRGILFDVGNHLWPGLPEADYQQAISIGLGKQNIPHTLEKQFQVNYCDVEVGRYYCDIIVDDKVILELKVQPNLTPLHRAQILSYLRVTGLELGLLVNFGGAKVEVERYAYFYAQRRADFAWHPQPHTDSVNLYPQLTGDLYRYLHQVHYELGPGFLHHIYRRATQIKLNQQHLQCDFIRDIPISYAGEYLGKRPCRLLLVEDKVVIAAFAVREMDGGFDSKMRGYLRHFDKKLGLLANFHGKRLVIRPIRIL